MSDETASVAPRRRTRLTNGAIRQRIAQLKAAKPDLSSAGIAAEIGIGVRTVKYHKRQLRDSGEALRLCRWHTGELVIRRGDIELELDKREAELLRVFMAGMPAGAAP